MTDQERGLEWTFIGALIMIIGGVVFALLSTVDPNGPSIFGKIIFSFLLFFAGFAVYSILNLS